MGSLTPLPIAVNSIPSSQDWSHPGRLLHLPRIQRLRSGAAVQSSDVDAAALRIVACAQPAEQEHDPEAEQCDDKVHESI